MDGHLTSLTSGWLLTSSEFIAIQQDTSRTMPHLAEEAVVARDSSHATPHLAEEAVVARYLRQD